MEYLGFFLALCVVAFTLWFVAAAMHKIEEERALLRLNYAMRVTAEAFRSLGVAITAIAASSICVADVANAFTRAVAMLQSAENRPAVKES